jgi:hypothetical protein
MEVLGRSPSFDFKQVLESISFQVLTSLAEEEEDLVKRREKTRKKKKSFMPSKVGAFFLARCMEARGEPIYRFQQQRNSSEFTSSHPHMEDVGCIRSFNSLLPPAQFLISIGLQQYSFNLSSSSSSCSSILLEL